MPKALQKNSAVMPYTQKELRRILKGLEAVRQGKVKISDLEAEVGKVTEFLQKLRQ